jgi:hypothetical protein
MNADLRDGYVGQDDYRWLWKAVFAGVRVIAIIDADGWQEVVSVRRTGEGGMVIIGSGGASYNQIYRCDTERDFAKFLEDCEDLNLRWLMPTGHDIQEAIFTANGEVLAMRRRKS